MDKVRKKVANAIYRPERTQQAWDRLHKEAGFIPILNLDDTETRRQQIQTILNECQTALFDSDVSKQREIVRKVFGLYFNAGNPWYRGLDDRELAEKVAFFLENCTEVAYMDEFIPDLFEEAMQLLSLSWKALDVTNTPTYIIESRPVVFPKGGGNVGEEQDETGSIEMQQEIRRLREKRGEKE